MQTNDALVQVGIWLLDWRSAPLSPRMYWRHINNDYLFVYLSISWPKPCYHPFYIMIHTLCYHSLYIVTHYAITLSISWPTQCYHSISWPTLLPPLLYHDPCYATTTASLLPVPRYRNRHAFAINFSPPSHIPLSLFFPLPGHQHTTNISTPLAPYNYYFHANTKFQHHHAITSSPSIFIHHYHDLTTI